MFKRNELRGILVSTFAVFTVAVLVQVFFFSKNYVWWESYQLLSPLSWDWMSFVTYLTIGSLLYHLGFYLALYRAMKAIGFSYRDYQAAKWGIWLLLMYVTYQVQLFAVHRINEAWSLYWNAIRLVVFLWPAELIAILFLSIFILQFSLKKTSTENPN